jgi:ATP-dependent DNA helicase HFM1/MER3
MARLLELGLKPSMQAVLTFTSQAIELNRIVLVPEERAFFRTVNSGAHIRWPLATTHPLLPWHKVYLLVQISLSGEDWPTNLKAERRKEIAREKNQVFGVVKRVLKCVVDMMGIRKDAVGLRNGLEILRSLEAGVWDEEPREILQITGVGRKYAAKLTEAGFGSCKKLAKIEPWNIERIIGRNTPYGTAFQRSMLQFPFLTAEMFQVGTVGDSNGQDVGKATMLVAVLGYENKDLPRWQGNWLRVIF